MPGWARADALFATAKDTLRPPGVEAGPRAAANLPGSAVDARSVFERRSGVHPSALAKARPVGVRASQNLACSRCKSRRWPTIPTRLLPGRA